MKAKITEWTWVTAGTQKLMNKSLNSVVLEPNCDWNSTRLANVISVWSGRKLMLALSVVSAEKKCCKMS